MPIYEYRCGSCDREFELLIRREAETPVCPNCGATGLEKQLSIPAAPAVQGSPLLPVCEPRGGSCGLPACQQGGCQMF